MAVEWEAEVQTSRSEYGPTRWQLQGMVILQIPIIIFSYVRLEYNLHDPKKRQR